MSAPSKPWESNAIGNRVEVLSQPDLQLGAGVIRSTAGRTVIPPPLPPRTRSVNPFSRQPYSSAYGPYYGNSLSLMGGGYGMPYGMRNHAMDFGNRYVQLAEESAAPAFESIENFVRGFSSVTLMLDSTFQALQMSFRAILGVAENMSRMRTALVEFMSAFAILKVIHHFYRKILYFLGIIKGSDISWKEAEAAVAKEIGKQATGKATKPYWPVIAFLSAIIALPALVYRYTVLPTTPEEEVTLHAIFDFDAEHPDDLSFRRGDSLKAKLSDCKNNRWILARKGTQKGYIPSNRVVRVAQSGNSKGLVKQGQPVKSTTQIKPITLINNQVPVVKEVVADNQIPPCKPISPDKEVPLDTKTPLAP